MEDMGEYDPNIEYSVTTGNKQKWQEYPCIVAMNKVVALIAYSEEEGEIVDTKGNVLKRGTPLDLGQNNDVGVPPELWSRKTHWNYEVNNFWKAKYPEYFGRQFED